MKVNVHEFLIALAKSGLNMTGLAGVSGISRQTLSAIRNGKSCRPDVVFRIAETLNVPIEQLVLKESEE